VAKKHTKRRSGHSRVVSLIEISPITPKNYGTGHSPHAPGEDETEQEKPSCNKVFWKKAGFLAVFTVVPVAIIGLFIVAVAKNTAITDSEETAANKDRQRTALVPWWGTDGSLVMVLIVLIVVAWCYREEIRELFPKNQPQSDSSNEEIDLEAVRSRVAATSSDSLRLHEGSGLLDADLGSPTIAQRRVNLRTRVPSRTETGPSSNSQEAREEKTRLARAPDINRTSISVHPDNSEAEQYLTPEGRRTTLGSETARARTRLATLNPMGTRGRNYRTEGDLTGLSVVTFGPEETARSRTQARQRNPGATSVLDRVEIDDGSDSEAKEDQERYQAF
jgi:hypothetical protein